MSIVHFTCPDCAQTIEVNDEMRETILDAGCPVSHRGRGGGGLRRDVRVSAAAITESFVSATRSHTASGC
ncbi:DUF7560 family zinc ribbon protein [Halorubrum sp. AS12]|uniref:DUF7560 family zinc ribbon protein n=1 Tax=Halorubrum sp. AS12 TaxID=3409687 RepID=UPI003DA74696